MKKKLPSIISKEVLEQKNTKALLAYLSKLQRCEESYDLSDMEVNLDLLDEEKIYFKQTEKWQTAYTHVKSILENRAHIEKRLPNTEGVFFYSKKNHAKFAHPKRNAFFGV